MTEMPPFRIRDAVLLLAVLVVAASVRGWYLTGCLDRVGAAPALAVQHPPTAAAAANDPVAEQAQEELEGLARNVREYAWGGCLAPLSDVEERTAHTAPGYAWVSGRLQRLLGDHAQAAVVLHWAQCGLGALTAGLYFLFARRAFRSTAVASLAGLLCALHPFWIINTAEFADGVLASFLLAACLFLGARAAQEGDPLCSLLYGLALAGLALTRAALLPFAAVACLWFLLRCRTTPRGWLCALLGFLGFANGLAPWTVRNWQAFGDIIPVADSMYLHLWKGVNRQATGGPQDEATVRATLLEPLQAPATPEDAAALRAARAKRLKTILDEDNQAKRYAMLAHDVVERVAADPAAALRGRFLAAGCFVFGERRLNGHDLLLEGWASNLPPAVKADAPLALEASLLALLLLALLGWRWTYGWRRESMPLSLAVIWIPLPYLLSHAEALSGPRLPLDGVLICYAAFALVCLVPGLGGKLLRGATPSHE
jgi:hypothetical protein